MSKMKTGYPRFFIHLIIQELEKEILKQYGKASERVMLFPSKRTSERCQAFFYDKRQSLPTSSVRLLHLEPKTHAAGKNVLSSLSCVFFPAEEFPTAKQVWQHSGDGISSRRGEFCLQALREGLLVPVQAPKAISPTQDVYGKGPRRYQRGTSQNNISAALLTNGVHLDGETNRDTHTNGERDFSHFIEERFGRNLNAELAAKAKRAICRRIAGVLTDNEELDDAFPDSKPKQQKPQQGFSPGDQLRNVSEHDVYLYPCGMSAIFNAHQLVMEITRTPTGALPSICFGFPYIDTLKTLEKWGPGCLFYGNGVDDDLDDLERRLHSGERFAGLFTEFPSNPLLRSPNLARIRKLADQYGFLVVVDETVGNYININVLNQADVVVSSLTKIFSGDSNVMGGSLVLNHSGAAYDKLQKTLDQQYEDNYWAEDAVFMERNSRDFVSRIDRINNNAETMAETLKASEYIKEVYYPKFNLSRNHYDACKTSTGGYGGLLSVTFHDRRHAQIFFDNLKIEKGPSLGTNFTLACPFVILAHYTELDWVQQFGVDPYLVRISVGLEEPEDLSAICSGALGAITAS